MNSRFQIANIPGFQAQWESCLVNKLCEWNHVQKNMILKCWKWLCHIHIGKEDKKSMSCNYSHTVFQGKFKCSYWFTWFRFPHIPYYRPPAYLGLFKPSGTNYLVKCDNIIKRCMAMSHYMPNYSTAIWRSLLCGFQVECRTLCCPDFHMASLWPKIWLVFCTFKLCTSTSFIIGTFLWF